MNFLLHHPTGVLLIEAPSRQEALDWSARQLGRIAGRAFIIDCDDERDAPEVERSGTGVQKASSRQSGAETESPRRVIATECTALAGPHWMGRRPFEEATCH